MGFMAKHFSFDGIPCERFGMRIYDIDGNNNKATPFASPGKIVSDAIPSTGKNYLYGRNLSAPLDFDLVFGLEPCQLDGDDYLDRFDMDAVARWLVEPTEYKWLEIEQPDMEYFRYRCVISELTPINIGWLPIAFTAKVVCDSPYGYRNRETFEYTNVSGNNAIHPIIENRSTLKRPYYPKLEIKIKTQNANAQVKIQTTRNNAVDREFILPLGNLSVNTVVAVDNERGVISSSNGENLYADFDFNWLYLHEGENQTNISVTGNVDLKIICDFPVDIGG